MQFQPLKSEIPVTANIKLHKPVVRTAPVPEVYWRCKENMNPSSQRHLQQSANGSSNCFYSLSADLVPDAVLSLVLGSAHLTHLSYRANTKQRRTSPAEPWVSPDQGTKKWNLAEVRTAEAMSWKPGSLGRGEAHRESLGGQVRHSLRNKP